MKLYSIFNILIQEILPYLVEYVAKEMFVLKLYNYVLYNFKRRTGIMGPGQICVNLAARLQGLALGRNALNLPAGLTNSLHLSRSIMY